jgi:adenosylcobinamide-GDP ribazoletransferase
MGFSQLEWRGHIGIGRDCKAAAISYAELMRFFSDLLACLRFYSRLPVPVLRWETQPHAMLDFAHAIRALPLAGLIIALPAAALLFGAGKILPPELAAGLALALFVLTTGAFHEDGLADTADGFGGGRSLERKLEIMRDSRIGTFGGAALVLSLLLRWGALVALLKLGPGLAACTLLGVAGLSRWCGLLPLALLPAARTDGAAFAADRPGLFAMALSLALALALLALPWAAGVPVLRLVLASLLAGLAALAMAAISRRQIKGQTGDVAGAAQQLAEITFLLTVLLRI